MNINMNKTLPSINEWKNMMSGRFESNNLDFAYNDLKDSFINFLTVREDKDLSVNFIIRFEYLKRIMQSVIYRNMFTSCRNKLINMYYMIIIFKIFNKYKL